MRQLWVPLIGLAVPEIAQAQPPASPMDAPEVEFRRDRPIVEAFLAGGPGAPHISGYRWFPRAREDAQNISNARFFELIAPCTVREISYSIVVTTTRFGPAPPPDYNGIDVYWTCTGPNAVAPMLSGHFDTSLTSVDLMPDPAMAAR